MHSDSGRSGCGRPRHFRRTSSWRDAPQLTGGAMAQHRRGARSEHRSHPAAFSAQRRVSDPVDAAMDREQRAAPQPAVDAARGKAQIAQLLPADHSVLCLRELSDRPVHPAATRPRQRRDPPLRATRAAFSAIGLKTQRASGMTTEVGARPHVSGAPKVHYVWQSSHKRGSSPPVPPLALIP